MVKQVTRWESARGRLFETEEAAREDDLIELLDALMHSTDDFQELRSELRDPELRRAMYWLLDQVERDNPEV